MRFLLKLFLVLLLIYGTFWLFSLKSYPVTFGLSFDIEYTKYLGLDWKKAYQSILTDLRPSYIRLSAPWNQIEGSEKKFDFSELDYLVKEAQKNNVKIVLAVGQKVPHWPECHYPEWVKEIPTKDERKPKLLNYVETVVNRYKSNPAIEFWQVENETFISFTFGECKIFDTTAITDEIALVRKLDPTHKILVTDSGELSTWYPAAKTADLFGTTLYRVARTPNKGFIIKYDWLPAAFYKARAKIFGLKHENFFVSELQAEPWFLHGGVLDNPVNEHTQTFDLKRFRKNITYTEHVGASRAYLWGVEWWYWMKEKHNDPTYWNEAREIMKKK